MIRQYLYRLMTDQTEGVFTSLCRGVLWLCSWMYRGAIALRSIGYRQRWCHTHRLAGVKVVSVGNLTWGGTGKTPLIHYVAQRLTQQGRRVAVLSRGYGEDEPAMLRSRLAHVPIVVGRNRVTQAQSVLRKMPIDLFLLDDGFQYWPLERDLDIVTIDATNPFGNGHLLPRGILREPIAAIRRAQVIVVTKTNVARSSYEPLLRTLKQLHPQALIIEAIHHPVSIYDPIRNRDLPFRAVEDQEVFLVSSIADPQSFESLATQHGIAVAARQPFLDHHRYTSDEVSAIVSRARAIRARAILTTEKDWVTLQGALPEKALQALGGEDGLGMWVMRMELVITKGEENLLERLATL